MQTRESLSGCRSLTVPNTTVIGFHTPGVDRADRLAVPGRYELLSIDERLSLFDTDPSLVVAAHPA
ncbi:MAG: hypothetical protein ABEH86_10720 [Haloarcula sp.]